MPLTLDSFRNIAGTGISTGFVGSQTDAGGNISLTKLGAHRHYTSLNAEEIKQANMDENGYIRSSLYAHLGLSLVGVERGKADAVLAYAREKLGIEIKPSDKPLERRVVRELIALRDEIVGAGASKMNRKDAAIVNFLNNPTREGCTFSSKDALGLLVALKSMRANGLASCEATVNGRTVYLMKMTNGEIHLRTQTGSCTLDDFKPMDGNQQLFQVLEEKAFTGDLPSPMTREFARSVAMVTSSPTLATDTHSPEAMRARAACADVLLAFGEGTVADHDLTTLSAFTLNKIVGAIADGRISRASELKGVVESYQTPDLLNADEAQAIAEQYQKSNAEDKARIEKAGEKPAPRPAPSSTTFGVFGFLGGIADAISAAKDKLVHKNEADDKKFQADVRNFLADVVCEEDTVEVDKRRGQPGARLAYTLDKHIDTLVTVLTDTTRAKALVPEEQWGMIDRMVDAVKDNLGDKAVSLLKSPSLLKTALKATLDTPAFHAKLAGVETQIDEIVLEKTKELQKTVSKKFVSVLTGAKEKEQKAEAGEQKAETGAAEQKSDAEKPEQKVESGVVEQKEEVDAEEEEEDEAVDEIVEPPRPAEQKADVEEAEEEEEEDEAVDEIVKPPRPAGQYRDLKTMIAEEAPDMSEDLAKISREPPKEPKAEEKTLENGKKIILKPDSTDVKRYREALAQYEKDLPKERLEVSRKLLGKLGGDAATDFTRGYGKFMLEVMSRYFSEMPTQDLRAMIASGIRNTPANASDGMKLGALLKGAGPIMHKMLQGLASATAVPDEFKVALGDMRSKLRPIPDAIVKANLLDMVKRSNGQIASIAIDHSLGAASVGQAFLCTFKMANGESRNVVVKMLRPDVETRMERERTLFESVAKTVSGMEVTFAGQLASIIDELDLRKEAANTEMGKVYNPGVADVKSMKVLDVVAPTKYTLAVEVAKGTTVDKLVENVNTELGEITKRIGNFLVKQEGKAYSYEEEDANIAQYKADTQRLTRMYNELHVQQKRLVTLAEKWATEGIFKSGFYHGDLHAGNIMVDTEFKYDEQGNMKLDGNEGLTVIDFGNATQLEESQKKYIIRMMAAAAVKDTNSFLDSFRELMTPGGRVAFDKERAEIHDLVHEIFNLGTGENSADRIFAVLQKLMQKGHELPGPIFKFSQCTIRLQGTLDEVTATLDKIKDTIVQARAKNQGLSREIPGLGSHVDLAHDVFMDMLSYAPSSTTGKEMQDKMNADLLAGDIAREKIQRAKGFLDGYLALQKKPANEWSPEERLFMHGVQDGISGFCLQQMIDSLLSVSTMEAEGKGDCDHVQAFLDALERSVKMVENSKVYSDEAADDVKALADALARAKELIHSNNTREAFRAHVQNALPSCHRNNELRNEINDLEKSMGQWETNRKTVQLYDGYQEFLNSEEITDLLGGAADRKAMLPYFTTMLEEDGAFGSKKMSDERMVAFTKKLARSMGYSEEQLVKSLHVDDPKLCRTIGLLTLLGQLSGNLATFETMTPDSARKMLKEIENYENSEDPKFGKMADERKLAELKDELKQSMGKFRQSNEDFRETHLKPLKEVVEKIIPAFTRQGIRRATQMVDSIVADQSSLYNGVNDPKYTFSDAIGNVIQQNLSKSALSMNARLGAKVIFKMHDEQIPV